MQVKKKPKKTATMSLFKDRDGDVMQNAASICSWFGYTNQGSVFISA